MPTGLGSNYDSEMYPCARALAPRYTKLDIFVPARGRPGTFLLLIVLDTRREGEANDDFRIDDARGQNCLQRFGRVARPVAWILRSREDGRSQLLRATSELRPSYPLYPTTIATKDAIQPSYRIASVRGL